MGTKGPSRSMALQTVLYNFTVILTALQNKGGGQSIKEDCMSTSTPPPCPSTATRLLILNVSHSNVSHSNVSHSNVSHSNVAFMRRSTLLTTLTAESLELQKASLDGVHLMRTRATSAPTWHRLRGTQFSQENVHSSQTCIRHLASS